MKGIIGELKRGVYTHFTFPNDLEPTGIITPNNSAPGYYIPIKGYNLVHLELAYGDIINKAVIVLHKNLACPKVRIYTQLSNAKDLAVPAFFVEDYMEIDYVNIVSERKTIQGGVINEALLASKTVNLFNRVFFEKLDPPLVRHKVIETDIGSLKKLQKSNCGVEL